MLKGGRLKMAKQFLGLIILSISLIIATTVSACSTKMSITTPASTSTSPSVSVSAPVTKTPSSTTLTSSKPIVLPGDTVTSMSASYVNFNLEELIKNTATAVTGKVTAILPAKQDETMLPETFFYTDVIIQPERYLYGKSQADRIAVHAWGGRIGDIVMMTGDQLVFTLGEE